MGKKDLKSLLKRNADSKSMNPISLVLAFIFGAVIAFVAAWRIRASKGKKGDGESESSGAADAVSAQTERELKELIKELRSENERRRREDRAERLERAQNDGGNNGKRRKAVQDQQIKPYRPRKRVSVKGILGRAVAVAAAAALVVTGLYMAPYERVPVSTVQARESFGGIKQVVEEHNEENPFVILDIVPGKAQAEVNGKKYDFSLGTIGYLAPGQSPIQKDLLRIFKGDGEEGNNEEFYKYSDRKALTDAVISNGYSGITYQEAYGGTGEDLRASIWSKIFDPVDVTHDENGKLPENGNYPTGRIYARVEKRPDGDTGTGNLPARAGFDYNLTWQPEGSTLFAASVMSVPSAEGVYTFAEGQGDYHVIFGEPVMAMSGYRAEVIKSGSYDEVLFGGSYSDTTGVYLVENGTYTYAGVIGNHTGTVIPKPEEPEEPTKPEPPVDPTDPEQPADPMNPDQPTDPEEPEQPTDPTDPEQPTDPVDPGQPIGPTDPEQPAEPQPDQPQPEQPDSPEPAPEQTPVQESLSAPVQETVEPEPVASAFRRQSVLKKAGAEDGWYLCVGTEPMSEPTPEPVPEPTPEPVPGPTPEPVPEPTPEPTPEPVPEPTPEPAPEPNPELPADGTYCVLKFTYVEAEEEQLLYQIKEVSAVSKEEGVPCPYDSYLLEKGLFLNSLNAAGEESDTDLYAAEPDLAGQFEYVGGGKGMYKITRSRAAENVVSMTGKTLQDPEIQNMDLQQADTQDGQDAEGQSVIVRAAETGSVHYIELQNAPVYIRCTGGNDFLRRYVFNSLKSQDNASDDFAITVNTVPAGDVTSGMVQEADLIYLEDGTGLYINQDAEKSYIGTDAAGDAADGLKDIGGDDSDIVITTLLREAVESLKPVIVDYGVIEDETNYADSKYQKLAKAFLKKDLFAFYHEMEKSKDLAASILMNVDSKDFPNKKDNDYHYVNRNVYLVNGTPLVGDDFPETMDQDKAKSGFSEVLAAIRAENVMLPEDDRISEKISKAMAVQYIINYSLGLVGEYKDISILELQPTANMDSDLHRGVNEDKGSVVLYWQRGKEGEGQQILRSSRMIETNVVVSSVAAFNTSYQDINADYNMIFIGLDGQRLYHEADEDGKLQAVYNEPDLNGKVYHTGDSVAGGGAKYDENDITEQKKKELLDYLRAGYPIVVENDCFKDRSARKADEEDINTKYIASDTQMYDFLKEAISMGRSEDDDDGESGVGIYTIEDVHSSAMFAVQLNALRPKIELRKKDENAGDTGGNDSEEDQLPSDMIEALAVPEKAGVLRGTIEYRITSDRMGEDRTYRGSLDRHLYLDLNYDGVFAPEEEFTGYEYEESGEIGRVSVDFNEINFGIVPWKLEVTDADNRYRRASTQGCFTISGGDKAKIRVLQVLDDTANDFANLQEIYEKIDNSMLGYYMEGAESLLRMKWDIETVTPDDLAAKLDKNANYLSNCDVVVLGFGESGNPGDKVMNAVNAFLDAGGGVLVSSAGASEEKGRLGLSAAVLGQKEGQKTYGKLGLHSDTKLRYDGMEARMFNKTPSLFLDRVNYGTISRWPYQINTGAQLGSHTETSMADYLLDIGTARDEDADRGKAYTTAWFTLLDLDLSKGPYSSSPRDGRNNYYVYSKGNVVYVGQSEYRYDYDPDSGIRAEDEGTDECMIFVNALMAAYNASVHRANVSIVAGFNGATKVESVTVPYDVAFKESGTDGNKNGILGETVDVYFRYTDNNIAVDKVTTPTFYYKNAGAPADAELLLANDAVNTAAYTEFSSPIWAVENNRLVEVTEGIVPDKVYRIKAPLTALQMGEDEMSQICVLLTSRYTRAGQSVEALSMDSVSLNRAQMFLLE